MNNTGRQCGTGSRHTRAVRHLACSLFGAVLLASASAWAEDPPDTLVPAESWVVRSWQTKDGLPQNTVNALLQTRDGYLWVGTSAGLARFDGVQFRNFGPQDGLRSIYIQCLLEDPSGVLWVGTVGGGVSRWDNGRFVSLAAPADEPLTVVHALAAGSDGTLWIGTPQGLAHWRNGKCAWVNPAAGLPAKPIRALLVDSQGVLWVSALPGGLYTGTAGRFAPLPGSPDAPAYAYSLGEDSAGAIWVGGGNGSLWRRQAGNWVAFGTTNGLPPDSFLDFARGPEGSLVIASRNAGLFGFKDGRFHRVIAPAELSDPAIWRVLVGPEDSLWVGTSAGGLNRLSRRFVINRGPAEGLGNRSVNSLAEDGSGALWVAARNGLWRSEQGRFAPVKEPSLLSRYPNVYAVLASQDGSLWSMGEQHLFRFRPDQPPVPFLAQPIEGEAIRTACADGPSLWLGTYFSTLLKVDGTNILVAATNGSFGGNITCLVREGPGRLWIGTSQGLYFWEPGRVRLWSTKDGLLSASIRALHRDPDGTLWLGTLGGGLSWFQENRFVNITTRQGLIDDVISQILPDDYGHLWLGCNHGLMCVRREDLQAVAHGTLSHLQVRVFGQNEGLLSEQCAGGCSPTAIKTRDGRLLFPTARGFAEVDPRRLPNSASPAPPTSIEEVLVDDHPQPPGLSLILPPGRHRLEVHYCAPSLSGDWLRFRSRLLPLDADWIQVGTRRAAFFSNLRPGKYLYCVNAGTPQGGWSAQITSLAFTVAPFFWETWPFKLLLAAALVAAAYLAYRRRFIRLEQRRLAQVAFTRQLIASQEQERARLARELHDDITQRLARLAIDVGRCERDPGAQPPADTARAVRESLIQLSQDVHALSYRLHPSILEDLGLADALRAEAERLSRSTGLDVRFKLDQLPLRLSREVSLCLFRVGQEALRNVARHAQAQKVTISLRGLDQGLQLAIQDDGRGFAPRQHASHPSLGIASMRERVEFLGGELDIESTPGHGTSIIAWVPLSTTV